MPTCNMQRATNNRHTYTKKKEANENDCGKKRLGWNDFDKSDFE